MPFDAQRTGQKMKEEQKNDGSGLIHQVASPLEGTEPRPGTLGVPLARRREPTAKDFSDPRFDVIWELIKRVDVDFCDGTLSGATGNDVCAVLDALDQVSCPPVTGIDTLVGRCICRDGINFTVQGASSTGEVRVWNPDTKTLLVFDSRETFENWAYGTPVSTTLAGARSSSPRKRK